MKFLIYSIILILPIVLFSQENQYYSEKITNKHIKNIEFWPGSQQLYLLYYMLDGKKDGPEIFYSFDGSISYIANYKDGVLNGKYTFFFKNGKSSVIGFNKNGQPIGTWSNFSRIFGKVKETEFDNNGNKIVIRRYLWGIKIFENTF